MRHLLKNFPSKPHVSETQRSLTCRVQGAQDLQRKCVTIGSHGRRKVLRCPEFGGFAVQITGNGKIASFLLAMDNDKLGKRLGIKGLTEDVRLRDYCTLRESFLKSTLQVQSRNMINWKGATSMHAKNARLLVWSPWRIFGGRPFCVKQEIITILRIDGQGLV